MNRSSNFALTPIAGLAVALLVGACGEEPPPFGSGEGGSASSVIDDDSQGPATTSSSNAGVGGGSDGSGGAAPACDDPAPGSNLGLLDDCDNSGLTLDSTLADAGDVDWYEFDGLDTFGCVVNPKITIDSPVMSELCAFFSCHEGETKLSCNAGAEDTTYSVGNDTHIGCCTLGDELKNFNLNCTGEQNDSAHVWVRVTSDQADCSEYTLETHF